MRYHNTTKGIICPEPSTHHNKSQLVYDILHYIMPLDAIRPHHAPITPTFIHIYTYTYLLHHQMLLVQPNRHKPSSADIKPHHIT